jgi:hypothetical protein
MTLLNAETVVNRHERNQLSDRYASSLLTHPWANVAEPEQINTRAGNESNNQGLRHIDIDRKSVV